MSPQATALYHLVKDENEAALRSALSTTPPDALDQTSLDHLLLGACETQNLTLIALLMKAGSSLTDAHLSELTDVENLAALRYTPHILDYPPHRQWEVEIESVNPIYSGGRLASTPSSPSTPSTTHGNVYTFGKSDFTLGYPSSNNNYKPKRIHSLSNTSIVSVAAGAHHVIALTSEGVTLTWGHGKSGRLGVGDSRVRMTPTPVLGSLTHRKVSSIACSDVHTLASTTEGEVYAWGSNRWGQLGATLTISTKESPRRIDGAIRKSFIVDVACSAKHSVALNASGNVYCWGSNENGQLGQAIPTGGNVVNHTPEIVSKLTASSGNGTLSNVYAIEASEESTCVILRKSSPGCGIAAHPAVFCFGYGDPNPRRIKFDPETKHDTKMPVSPIAIACGKHQTCCVTASGSVYVWGSHLETPFAPTSSSPSKPILVPNLPPAISVSASSTHTAIITRTGQVYTWGSSNINGGLGVEGRKHASLPVKVEGIRRCVGVAVGQEHTVCLSAFGRPSTEEEEENEESESTPDLLNTTVDTVELDEDTETEAPDTTSTPSFDPPSLQRHCELAIAHHVDTHNIITILEKAASFYSTFLIDYCCEFLGANLDGILERLIAGKRRSELDFLLDFIAGDDQSCEAFMDEGFYEAIRKPEDEDEDDEDDFSINWDDKNSLIENHKKAFKALRKAKKKSRTSGQGLDDNTQALEKLLHRISDRMVHLGAPKEVLKQNMAIKKAAEQTKFEEKEKEKKKAEEHKPEHPPPPKPRYRCEACGVEAPDEANLQIHMGGKRHRNTLIRLQKEPSSQQQITPKKGWSPSPSNTSSTTCTTITPTPTPSPQNPPPQASFFNMPALPPSPLNFRELMEQQESQKNKKKSYKISPQLSVNSNTSNISNMSRSPNSDATNSVSGSPPSGINLGDFMKNKITPQKIKYVGALGTLLEKKVVSPWKLKPVPEVKDHRQRGFSDILEEEARVREGEMEAASPAGTGHWFVERRQRGDSLEAIQLAEEEARQRRQQEEREREEIRQQKILLQEATKSKQKQTKTKKKRGGKKPKGGPNGESKGEKTKTTTQQKKRTGSQKKSAPVSS